ncbi:TetR/AcrR family transcriptional regulator [Mycolicibacterium sp. CBMA 226]|uniref:TetR/AcrR family transcriptional regulator n=1 Tax=Mycolicibacterium sp. CBMA 226 TaxID=2606611 RepID=UPI00130574F9|nr:TetR/AcrR family transcriptional regulator [Mycolicibacterium sp. CBMA 226]MUL79866.1 TetR/AcrR family transcriptional regulator [Mycolicibacterium sp. CBMA 226]
MSEETRRQLIEAGIAILERDGLQALSVRKLAAEVGTSTMVVYTHFGSMAGVVDALSAEIFARFGDALASVPHTDDPVADFFSMGAAYRRFALKNPQHYQLMFGTAVPASLSNCRTDLTVTGHATSRDASFQTLCASVRRMTDAGRIRNDGEAAVAGRIWSICHGAVMLEMAGFFGSEGHGLRDILSPLTVDFLVGMGDERDRANASLATAAAALLASGHL